MTAVFDLDIWGSTDRGRQRSSNEDSIYPDSSQSDPVDAAQAVARGRLLIVADGVGGVPGGGQASQIIVTTVRDHFYAQPADVPANALWQSCNHANALLCETKGRDSELRDAASTLTAALMVGDALYVAHVGDSRAYIQRGGHVHQLTHDHTSPAGELARWMGQANISIDMYPPVKLIPGDVVILCSDGLTNALPPSKLPDLIGGLDSRRGVRKLIESANRAGGPDNISVIVARARTAVRRKALLPPAVLLASKERLSSG